MNTSCLDCLMILDKRGSGFPVIFLPLLGSCCLYLWAIVHLEWKNKARSLDLNYFYFCAKWNFPPVMCYSFGIFWYLLASRERFAVRRENAGFLGEEIFLSLKPCFFCTPIRVETPALWLKHVLRIYDKAEYRKKNPFFYGLYNPAVYNLFLNSLCFGV